MSKALTKPQKAAAAKLNPRQLAFANLVLTKPVHGMSEGECYAQAGYASKTPGAIRTNASMALNRARVVAYMNLMREDSVKKTLLSLENLDKDLEHSIFGIAITDVVSSREVIEGDDTFHVLVLRCAVDDIPREVAKNIQEMKQTQHGLQVKMYSRNDARKLGYERLGGLTQKLEVTTPDLTPWSSITAGVDEP
ncbi:MAG: hypothetical protein KAT62_01810 [Desulfuromonadales bacterium]|nr:hypothetical protein [Desulfuromonadales bacterium]